MQKRMDSISSFDFPYVLSTYNFSFKLKFDKKLPVTIKNSLQKGEYKVIVQFKNCLKHHQGSHLGIVPGSIL